jgi:hypothetical protein
MFRLSIAIVLAALALPAAALAKGPTEGTISGAGFVKTFKVSGDGSPGTLGGDLTQAAGFFPAAFGQSPDPMLHRKPTAALGAAYAIVWTVPTGNGTPDRIRQVVYPYAKGGGVTYMKPGQPIFDMTTRGGWYRNPDLKRTLVSLGLPAKAPSASADGTSWTLPAGLGAAALLLLAAGLLFWHRQRGQRSPSTSSTELPAGSRT